MSLCDHFSLCQIDAVIGFVHKLVCEISFLCI